MWQDEDVYIGVNTARKYTCLCDELCANGGCEAAVTVRTRFCWVKFKECDKLLWEKRFHLNLERAVYVIGVCGVLDFSSTQAAVIVVYVTNHP